MKYAKVIGASFAIFAASLPMVAQAQTAPATVIGNVTNVTDGMIVLREGNYLDLQEGSAILTGDTVFTMDGSGTMNVKSADSLTSTCSQFLTSDVKVEVGTENVCKSIGTMVRVDAEDVVLAAGTGSRQAAYVLIGTAAGLGGIIAIANDGNDVSD